MSTHALIILGLITWCCLATAFRGVNIPPLSNSPSPLSRTVVVSPWGLDTPMTDVGCDDSVSAGDVGVNILGDRGDEDEDEDELSGMEWNAYTDNIADVLNGRGVMASFNDINNVHGLTAHEEEILSNLASSSVHVKGHSGRTTTAGSWTQGGLNGITHRLGSSRHIGVGSVKSTGVLNQSGRVVGGGLVGGTAITGNEGGKALDGEDRRAPSGGLSSVSGSSFNILNMNDDNRISSIAEAFQLFAMAYEQSQPGGFTQTVTIPDPALLGQMVRDFRTAQQSTSAAAQGTTHLVRGTQSHNNDVSVSNTQNNVIRGTVSPFEDTSLSGAADAGRSLGVDLGSIADFQTMVNMLADKLASDAGISTKSDSNDGFSTFGSGGYRGSRPSNDVNFDTVTSQSDGLSTFGSGGHRGSRSSNDVNFDTVTSQSDGLSATGISESSGQIIGATDTVASSANTVTGLGSNVGWIPSGDRFQTVHSNTPWSNIDIQQNRQANDFGVTTSGLVDSALFARVMTAGNEVIQSGERGSASTDSNFSRRLTNTIRLNNNDNSVSNSAVRPSINVDFNTIGSNRHVWEKPSLFTRFAPQPAASIRATMPRGSGNNVGFVPLDLASENWSNTIGDLSGAGPTVPTVAVGMASSSQFGVTREAVANNGWSNGQSNFNGGFNTGGPADTFLSSNAPASSQVARIHMSGVAGGITSRGIVDLGLSDPWGTINAASGSSRTTFLNQGPSDAGGTPNIADGSSRTTFLVQGPSDAGGSFNIADGSSRTTFLNQGPSDARGNPNIADASSRTTFLVQGPSDAGGSLNIADGNSGTAFLNQGPSDARGTPNIADGSSSTALLVQGPSDAGGNLNTGDGSTSTATVDQVSTGDSLNTAGRHTSVDPGYDNNLRPNIIRIGQSTSTTVHGYPGSHDKVDTSTDRGGGGGLSSIGNSDNNPAQNGASSIDNVGTSVGTSLLSSNAVNTGSSTRTESQGSVNSQTETIPQNGNMFSSDSLSTQSISDVAVFRDSHGNVFRLFRMPSLTAGSVAITSVNRQGIDGHSSGIPSISPPSSASSASASSNQATLPQMSTGAEPMPGTTQVDRLTSSNNATPLQEGVSDENKRTRPSTDIASNNAVSQSTGRIDNVSTFATANDVLVGDAHAIGDIKSPSPTQGTDTQSRLFLISPNQVESTSDTRPVFPSNSNQVGTSQGSSSRWSHPSDRSRSSPPPQDPSTRQMPSTRAVNAPAKSVGSFVVPEPKSQLLERMFGGQPPTTFKSSWNGKQPTH